MVSPDEIESIIRNKYPDLKFCIAAVNDPNGIWGSVPAIFCEDKRIAMKDVLKRIDGDIEEYKKPHLFFYVKEIPKTHNDKIKRKELSSAFC